MPLAILGASMKRRKTRAKTGKAQRHMVSRRPPASKTAHDRGSVPGAKETETAQLRRERDEALEWQEATGEILSSMDASMVDPSPVFDAIVRNLIRLFGTKFAVITLIRDDKLELVGVQGELGFEKLAAQYPV